MVNVLNIFANIKMRTGTEYWLAFRGHSNRCPEPVAPDERATWVRSPRLRGVGAAEFWRDFAVIGRDRVSGNEAPGG